MTELQAFMIVILLAIIGYFAKATFDRVGRLERKLDEAVEDALGEI